MHNKKMPVEFVQDFNDLRADDREVVIMMVKELAAQYRESRPKLTLFVDGSPFPSRSCPLHATRSRKNSVSP